MRNIEQKKLYIDYPYYKPTHAYNIDKFKKQSKLYVIGNYLPAITMYYIKSIRNSLRNKTETIRIYNTGMVCNVEIIYNKNINQYEYTYYKYDL